MSESIHERVIADLRERKRLGIATYGEALRAHNGRNALRDAYEEALDLACYLRQALDESALVVAAVRALSDEGAP